MISLYLIDPPPDSQFIPDECPDATSFGPYCNVSATACTTLQPCGNNGTCTDNNTQAPGYSCNCASGFAGAQCQLDQRPCQPTTCWNNGEHVSLSLCSSSFSVAFAKVRAMRRRIAPSFACVLRPGEAHAARRASTLAPMSPVRTTVSVDHRYSATPVNVSE